MVQGVHCSSSFVRPCDASFECNWKHLKKGDLEFEASVVIRSCILLLEQLMKISPEIRPRQKKKQWKLPLIGVKKIELTLHIL
jgi:hypothetical protein